MHPKLKEDPREWQKFAIVVAAMAGLALLVLRLRGVLSQAVMAGGLIALSLGLAAAWIRPAWFRGFYRGGMTVSFHAGQFMGRVLLTVFFLAVLTPMGWLLRALGKDLLRLKKPEQAETYWQAAKKSQNFDRMF
jgi:MFS family permease